MKKMGLNREQIMKALECCACEEPNCEECPYESGCYNRIFGDALTVVKELTEERTDHITMLLAKDVEISNLTEENERLKARVLEESHLRHQTEEMLANGMDVVRADTVRKMQERLKQFFGGTCQSDVTLRIIFDKIAKEMLEGDK